MELFYSPTSPYARKVRVLARELDLMGQIKEVKVVPSEKPDALMARTPLARVPMLTTKDGLTLPESSLIARYLIKQHFPAAVPNWAELRYEALCSGMLDMAITVVMDRRRENHQDDAWIASRLANIQATLAGIYEEWRESYPEKGLAVISLACTLDYLNLRLPELEWEKHYPALADWLHEVLDCQFYRQTDPRKV